MESFRSRGFTLVELMVVLAIIVTITTVVLTSQSTFNKTLILANTAYDIALTLRSAETYGLSTRAFGSISNAGYGLHFQSATPGSFTMFLDSYPAVGQLGLCHRPPVSDPTGPDAKPGNCVYESGQGEKVSEYTLGNAITISDFCVFTDRWTCALAQGGGLSSLDVVFTRPNPDAFMSANGSYSELFPVTRACLVVSSPQGGWRFITIGSSGQIVANAASDPSSCHE